MIGKSLHDRLATGVLYILNFLLGIHTALVVYFNSSFLESRGINSQEIGTLYIAGAFASLLSLLFTQKILTACGAYRTLLLAGILEMLLFFGLAFIGSQMLVMIIFVAILMLQPLIFFGLDVLLENYTKPEDTSETRSSFLTTINIAFVASPFIAGQLMSDGQYEKIYFISALVMVPFIILMSWNFRGFVDPVYKKFQIKPIIHKLFKSHDLWNIFIVQFMIRFFFSWMVIYVPLYLSDTVGFTLTQIGVMFSIMLLPFALLEYPLGHFIDKKFGEKEFLIIGFIIMALATATISFITTADFIVWTVILLLTRVGAATVEVMNEIYFFKHVHGDDLDTISSFRVLRPLAYIIGPAVGTLLLTFMDMRFLFVSLACILFVGIFASARIKDTL